jgi:CHAT domain-containing protein/tetratricopeptide (TPR) repeat protein
VNPRRSLAAFWMRLILLVLGSAALLLQCRPDEVRHLRPGHEVKRKLGQGQTHSYVFSASPGDFLLLELEQQGADLELQLFDSEGRILGKEDLQLGGQGAQILPAVVESTGEYRVEIRPNSSLKGHGRYILHLAPLRQATTRDRQRAAAARARYEGGKLSESGDSDKAAGRFEEALKLASHTGDERQAAVARLVWASLQSRSYSQRARLELARARDEFKKQGDLAHEESALFSLGSRAFQQEEIKEALDFYREAHDLAGHLKGDFGRLREAKVLSGMALVYKHLGDYDLALGLYGDSLDLWPEGVDDEGRIMTLNNLGEFYLATADPDQALRYFWEALRLNPEVDSKIQILSGIGLAYQTKNNPTQALAYLEQALHLGLSAESETGFGLSKVLVRISAVYLEDRATWRTGLNLFVSEVASQKALSLARQSRNWSMESNAIAILGRLQHLKGRPAEAVRFFEGAGARARKRLDQPGELGALFGRAQAEWSLGKLDQAERTLDESRKLLNAFRESAITDTMRRSVFSLQRQHFSSSIALLMERHQKEPQADFAVRAFNLGEAARARTLLDDLMREPIGEEEDQSLSEEERQLNQEVRSKRRQRNRLDEVASPQRQEIEQEIKGNFWKLEQLQAQHRPVNLSDFQPLSLQEVRSQVLDDDKTLLLSYWLADEGSFLWAVDRQSETVYRLPPKARIEELARSIRLTMSEEKGSEQESFELLVELSRQVLLPVADLLGDRRLLIVADGELQSVPWGALPDPGSLRSTKDDAAIRLVKRHTISVLPSASVLAALRQKLRHRPPAPKEVAVIANPKYRVKESADSRGEAELRVAPLKNEAKYFRELQHTQEEADAILKLFPADSEFHAFREEASRELVMGDTLSSYQIIHFAVHGISDPVPELSGLVLAQVDELGRERNGFVHAFEIARLNLPAELVVLSACQTGVGRNVPGEGVLNLTRAFFSAGARRVIVSLWDVDDEATAQLMRYFYEAYQQKGLSPSEALRDAQNRMSASEQWSHPYYWAAFVLQGEW